jgi:hypothetical protein
VDAGRGSRFPFDQGQPARSQPAPQSIDERWKIGLRQNKSAEHKEPMIGLAAFVDKD